MKLLILLMIGTVFTGIACTSFDKIQIRRDVINDYFPFEEITYSVERSIDNNTEWVQLDTGASISTIHISAVKTELRKCSNTSPKTIMGKDLSMKDMKCILPESVRIGSSLHNSTDIEVVSGNDRSVVGTDIANGKVIFLDFENLNYKIDTQFNCSGELQKHTYQRNDLIIPLKIGNLNISASLDTGATTNVIDSRLAKELNLKTIGRTKVSSGWTHGNTEPVDVRVVKLPTMNVSGEIYTDQIAIVHSLGHPEHRQMLLGNHFLMGKKICFDFRDKSNRVWSILR